MIKNFENWNDMYYGQCVFYAPIYILMSVEGMWV